MILKWFKEKIRNTYWTLNGNILKHR